MSGLRIAGIEATRGGSRRAASWAVGLGVPALLLLVALVPRGAGPPLVVPQASNSAGGPVTAGPPLSFVPNRGQTDPRVHYQAQAAGLGIFLSDSRVTIAAERGGRGHALELRFIGADPHPDVVAGDRRRGRVNYLSGPGQRVAPDLRCRDLSRPLAGHRHGADR